MSLTALVRRAGAGQAEPVPARGRAARRRLPPAAVGVRADRLVPTPCTSSAAATAGCRATTSAPRCRPTTCACAPPALLQAESGTPLRRRHLDRQAACPGAPAWAAAVPTRPRTLLALNRLWGLDWPRARLLALGADARRRRAVLRRRPQRLRRGHRRAADAAGAAARSGSPCVKPAAGASPRATIFEQPGAGPRHAKLLYSRAFLQTQQNAGFWQLGYGRNDLQPPAEERCRDVAQAAEWLRARFGNSRMTGSGSAVFARAGTGDQPVATWPAEELPPGWVGRMCRSLDAAPACWAGPD